MKEFIDKTSKRFVRVEVIEPVTITTKEHLGWSSSFTTYLIYIKTNHWAFSLQESEVRRRFSDFCWLRAKLQEHHPNKVVPPLPAKRYFHTTKFDPTVIQDRCQGLEKFIQRVMRSFVFLSDAALHLFLQSELTLPEIETKLAEEIKPQYVTSKRMHLTTTSSATRDPSPKPEFTRSVSDDGSNRSSSFSNSGSENDSHRLSTTSCGGSSVEVCDSEFLDHAKINLSPRSASRADKMGDLESHSGQYSGTAGAITGTTLVQIHSSNCDSYD